MCPSILTSHLRCIGKAEGDRFADNVDCTPERQSSSIAAMPLPPASDRQFASNGGF
jgi:hypothetical protein